MKYIFVLCLALAGCGPTRYDVAKAGACRNRLSLATTRAESVAVLGDPISHPPSCSYYIHYADTIATPRAEGGR